MLWVELEVSWVICQSSYSCIIFSDPIKLYWTLCVIKVLYRLPWEWFNTIRPYFDQINQLVFTQESVIHWDLTSLRIIHSYQSSPKHHFSNLIIIFGWESLSWHTLIFSSIAALGKFYLHWHLIFSKTQRPAPFSSADGELLPSGL